MKRSNQQNVQTELFLKRRKRRIEMSEEERLQTLQRKLYLKAKQEIIAKVKGDHVCMGQQTFDMLVKGYGLIDPYVTTGRRPVYA